MHYQEDLSLPTAIIMGSEEIGIRQKTLEKLSGVILLLDFFHHSLSFIFSDF